ncbi:MAG: hypothetical protein QME63_10700 [Actinomycetota bacterium]|nr:hypothetical protein [Actinomycetota bacterium]
MSKPTEEVLKKVKEASKNGRISCTAARELGKELNVSLRMIGDACNELKIKIYACELGCF